MRIARQEQEQEQDDDEKAKLNLFELDSELGHQLNSKVDLLND